MRVCVQRLVLRSILVLRGNCIQPRNCRTIGGIRRTVEHFIGGAGSAVYGRCVAAYYRVGACLDAAIETQAVGDDGGHLLADRHWHIQTVNP